VKRDEIARALEGEVRRVTYGNFKDSVTDDALHNAYLRVWTAMISVQPLRGVEPRFFGFDDLHPPIALRPIDAPAGKQHIRGGKSRRKRRRGAKVGVRGQ
jgi:hypothetical protein